MLFVSRKRRFGAARNDNRKSGDGPSGARGLGLDAAQTRITAPDDIARMVETFDPSDPAPVARGQGPVMRASGPRRADMAELAADGGGNVGQIRAENARSSRRFNA